MHHSGVATALAIMLSAVLASSSADAGSKRGGRVTVTGCPQPGVTGNCLMLRAKDGTLYNITGASPRPRPARRMIRVRGTVADKASICGQGIVLDRIRWTRTRQRCPK